MRAGGFGAIGFQDQGVDMSSLSALLDGTVGQGSHGAGWQGDQWEPKPSQQGLEAQRTMQQRHAEEKEARKAEPEENVSWDLSRSVVYWTDYCKAQFHARSHVEITSRMARFDLFGHGQEAMRDGDKGEEVLDQLRWFCEECDSLQAFSVPADIEAGFGSCAKEILTELADQYPRTPKFLMGLSPPASHGLAQLYDVNAALCTAMLPELVAVYSPVSPAGWADGYFPQLQLQTNNDFETSAVVATAWDTLAVPWRLSRDGTSVASVAQSLVRRPGANLASMDLTMPLPAKAEDYKKGASGRLVNLSVDLDRMPRRLDEEEDGPYPRGNAPSFSDYMVLRGIEPQPGELEAQIRAYADPCRHRLSFLWAQPMRVPIPYPHYFRHDSEAAPEALSAVERRGAEERLVHKGELAQKKPGAAHELEVLPVLARLHCGSANQRQLRHMADRLEAAMSFGSVRASFVSTGLEADELEEAKERLLQTADEYDET